LCRDGARRDRQNVLERLHGTANAKPDNSGSSPDTSKMLSFVTFPEVPPCLRPLGDALVCEALWKLLATVLDTACSHLLSEAPVDTPAQAGTLAWVNDSCIQQTLHLIALAISAADQDKHSGSLGGTVWKRLSANLVATGVRGGDGTGSAIMRRRSVIESLVLLQSPVKGLGGGAVGGGAQSCRFQKELHAQLVKSILRKLCDGSAECRERYDAASLQAASKTSVVAGVGVSGGSDSESSGRGGEDEDWKRRQKEAKERMMQVRGKGLCGAGGW
jgi:hypothetical protein